jgi:hypothetical protein
MSSKHFASFVNALINNKVSLKTGGEAKPAEPTLAGDLALIQ